MVTKVGTKLMIWVLVFSLVVPTGVTAQDTVQVSEMRQNHTYTQEELDRMLAPIALYPDELLSQILMAATYPLEVVEADRWLRKNQSLTGGQLDEALKDQPWDVSIKSLCHYPQILATMSENLTQTSNLGEAFLGQQDQVMDTVQRLRGRARAQGNLKSNEQQEVIVEGPDVIIQPVNPQYVYVPAYDPCWVYGSWWYPTCSPLWFWYPGLIAAGAFFFGPPVYVGHWGRWCGFQWRRRAVFVDVNRTLVFNRAKPSRMHGGSEMWRHDPVHRRGVAYRNEGNRQRYGQAGPPGVEARRDFRGFGPVERPPGGPEAVRKTPSSSRDQEQRRPQQQREEARRPRLGEPQVERLQTPRPPEGQRQQSRGQEVQRQQPRTTETQRVQPGREATGTPQRAFTQPSRGGDSFQGFGRGPEIRQQSERGWGSMGAAGLGGVHQGGQPSFRGGRGDGAPGGGGSPGGVFQGGSTGGAVGSYGGGGGGSRGGGATPGGGGGSHGGGGGRGR